MYKDAFARASEAGLSFLNLLLVDANTLEEKIERMKKASIDCVRVSGMDAFQKCLDVLDWLIEDVHLKPVAEKESANAPQIDVAILKLANQAAADAKARIFMSIQKDANPHICDGNAPEVIKALSPRIAQHWFATEDENLADEILSQLLDTPLCTKKAYDVFLSILRDATSTLFLPLGRLTRHYLMLVEGNFFASVRSETRKILAIALARTKNDILDSENTLLSLELRVVRHLEGCTSRIFALMEKVAVQLAESGSKFRRPEDVKITFHFEDGDQIIE